MQDMNYDSGKPLIHQHGNGVHGDAIPTTTILHDGPCWWHLLIAVAPNTLEKERGDAPSKQRWLN